jgi:signal peptidase II
VKTTSDDGAGAGAGTPAAPAISTRERWLVPAIVFAVTMGLDQLTKILARAWLTLGRPSPVLDGYWDWELAENPGAAFSMFGDGTARWLLAAIAMIAVVAIGWMIKKSEPQQRLLRVALALVAGGALGNLIDRVALGVVTDFVRWRWQQHRWPIFNIADVALVVGAGLIIVDGLRKPKPAAPPPS